MADISISAPVQPLPLSVEQRIGYGWGDYGRRGSNASGKVSRERAKCEHCGVLFSVVGLPRHRYTCLRKHQLAEIAPKPLIMRHHDTCTCGRIKAMRAQRCFQCGDYDPIVFWCLNLLIRAKIETSREKLALAGVQVDNPRMLAEWIAGETSCQTEL